ncbi:MAG: putative porin [Proteobacteria bacterium]|nr:putative porin [Pseudomonadota bacterium]
MKHQWGKRMGIGFLILCTIGIMAVGAWPGFSEEAPDTAVIQEDVTASPSDTHAVESTGEMIDEAMGDAVVPPAEAQAAEEGGVVIDKQVMDLSAQDLFTLEENISQRLLDQIKDKVKNDIRREMRMEDKNWLDRMHLSVPEWSRRVRLYGDFRVRYEGIFYNDENGLILNPQDTSSLINTLETENRFRMRARIGIDAEINKQADLVLRLATGSSGNPVSTNDTLGDYFNKDSILVDMAYLKLRPMPTKPEFNVYMGRFPSPWVGTDLIWDGDLGFEGLALSLDTRKTRTFGPIATIGAFPLQEEEWYADKWLFGGQLGFEYRPSNDLSFVLTSAYYHYENLEGTVNTSAYPNLNDWTSPLYQQKGNTLININADSTTFTPGIASKFELADVTAYVDCAWYYPVHVKLTVDAVENLGFDKDTLIKRTGVTDIKDDTTGYKVELMVGHPKVRSFGEWQWVFAYKYLGADAVVDAFTDSDFHMGGTNAQGWSLKGEFGILKNIWIGAQWITANEIHGPQLAIDQLQLDMNVSF